MGALLVAAAACSVLLAPGAEAGDDLRDRRWIRAEPPWWRRALAAPDRAVDVLSWPLERSVVWAEQTNLPQRVKDVLYFDDEETFGWFPNFSFGGEIGSAAGFRLFHQDLFDDEIEVELSTLFSFEGFSRGPTFEEQKVGFSYLDPHWIDTPIALRAEVDFIADRDEDFFVRRRPGGGLETGMETGEDDQSTYAIDHLAGRFEAGWRFVGPALLGLAFRPRFAEVRRGEGLEPGIPASIPGFGGPDVLLGGGPLFEWDDRERDPAPREGWYAFVDGGAWTSLDESAAPDGRPYRFARYLGVLERYQPTFRPNRILFLRASVDRTEPFDGGAVPFWELPILDEDHGLRAFERNRFRDRGALLVNVEYRYPIWDTWDGYLFFDEGQVFDRWTDVDPARFEWSAGTGIRFYTSGGFLVRAVYAVGPEGQSLRFGLTEEFGTR